MVEHVHAGRRIVQHQAARRVLNQGLVLPQGETVGQVRICRKHNDDKYHWQTKRASDILLKHENYVLTYHH